MSFSHYLVSYLRLNYCLNSSNIYRIYFSSTVLKTHCFEIFTVEVREQIELFLHANWRTTSTSRAFHTHVNPIVHLMAENKFLDRPCNSSTNKTHQTTNSSLVGFICRTVVWSFVFGFFGCFFFVCSVFVFCFSFTYFKGIPFPLPDDARMFLVQLVRVSAPRYFSLQ